MNMLTLIPDTMLAIACLDPKDETVCGHVHRLWDERFSAHNSFWLDMCRDGEQDLVQNLKEQQAKINLPPNMNKDSKYQISVFLDLREPLGEEMLKKIKSFYFDFSKEFPSEIRSIMFYCYVGRYNGYNEVPNINENIRMLLRLFPDGRLCQVGENSPGERNGECWIPVLAVVDVMRRYPNLMIDYDVNLRLGYIQYHLYSKALREQKERLLLECAALLREGDESCIQAFLMEQLDRLDEQLKNDYDIKGELQPIHPDLRPSRGGCAWFTKLWKKQDVGAALQSTRYAVERTGARLSEMIDAHYNLTPEQADRILAEMVAQAGLKQLSSGAFARVLGEIPEMTCREPSLRLIEGTDNAENIHIYLSDCYNKARSCGHEKYRTQIYEAYLRYASKENFAELWKQAREKYEFTAEHLKRLPDFSAFCSNCVERDEGLIGYVRMDGRGEGVYLCLYEGNDEEEAIALDKACTSGSDLTRRIHAFRLVNDFSNNQDIPAMIIRLSLFLVKHEEMETEV